MARPLVGALSKLCELVEVSRLNEEETESLTTACAALLYQEGQELNAYTLLAFALLGVVTPRLAEFQVKRSQKAQKLPPGTTEIPIDVVNQRANEFREERAA